MSRCCNMCRFFLRCQHMCANNSRIWWLVGDHMAVDIKVIFVLRRQFALYPVLPLFLPILAIGTATLSKWLALTHHIVKTMAKYYTISNAHIQEMLYPPYARPTNNGECHITFFLQTQIINPCTGKFIVTDFLTNPYILCPPMAHFFFFSYLQDLNIIYNPSTFSLFSPLPHGARIRLGNSAIFPHSYYHHMIC